MNVLEEKQLFGALTAYRGRGAFLRRLEQFEKAKLSYDEAFKSCPEDIRTLIGRSQVCADAMQPAQAYDDAELALKLEPENMVARNMQAQAMYTMADFERSVVMSHRGERVRKQPPYFREGIAQGMATLQDCIGNNTGDVMIQFLPLIKHMETDTEDDGRRKSLHVSRIPKQEQKKKMTQNESRKHEKLSRVLAMKYLGPMAYDKFYLQELVENPCINSANAAGSKELKSIATRTLKSLSERQEMLRSQRPYYSIKLAEKAISERQNKYKEAVLEKEREIGARMAENMLRMIDKNLWQRLVKDVVIKAEKMQMFLDSKTPRNLPDKEMYTDRLYKAVGEAYLSQYRLSSNLDERCNRRRVAFLMGLPIERSQVFDEVVANFPYRYVDIDTATRKLATTFEMCENATMKCWLLYSLAQMTRHKKNFALAKFYAKRCQKEAQESGNVTWWLNGCFTLMSMDMQQGNTNEIRLAVEEAVEWSKKMANPEQVQGFLLKCAAMASEVAAADKHIAALRRERQLTRVLLPEQKVEAEVLFKRMWTVPEGRRFPVLSGRMPAEGPAERRRYRQRGLTIVPGAPKTLPAPPRSVIPGFQKFDT